MDRLPVTGGRFFLPRSRLVAKRVPEQAPDEHRLRASPSVAPRFAGLVDRLPVSGGRFFLPRSRLVAKRVPEQAPDEHRLRASESFR